MKKFRSSLDNTSQGDIGPDVSTMNTMNALPHDDEVLNPRDYALNKLMMTEAQFERYSHGFELLDLSHSGKISKLEFEKVIGFFALANDLSHEEINDLFAKLDDNNKGYFTMSEFLREFNNTTYFKILARLVKAVVSKENEINEFSIDMKLEKGDVEGVEDVPRENFDFENIGESPTNQVKEGLEKNERKSVEIKEFKDQEEQPEVKEPIIEEQRQEVEEPPVEHKDRKQISIDYARQVLKMEDSYIESLIKVYEALDINNEGSISKIGFDEILRKFSLTEEINMEDFESLFNEMDRDQNGMISLIDFLENIHDSNLSYKLNYMIDNILTKHDKKLSTQRKQDIAKRNPLGYLGVRDTEFKESERKLHQQIEDFTSWLDVEQGIKFKTKVDLKKCFTALFPKPTKKETKLSEAEKASHLGLLIDTIGKELRQQNQNVKRITELERALEEERRFSHMDHSLNDELEENIKRVDQDVTTFNMQMMENIKIMEDRFRVDTDTLKLVISEKDEELRQKDEMLEEVSKINDELLINKRDLEIRLKEYEQKISIISESQETFLNDRDQQLLENERLQSLIQNLSKENEAKMAELENTRQRIITTIDNTQQTETSQDEEKINLVRQIKNLEKERSSLFRDLNDVQKVLEEASAEETERKKQIEQLNLQIQQSISAELHHNLMREKDIYLQDSQNLKSQLEILAQEQASAREQRKELQSKIQELEVEKIQLREACNTVNNDLKAILKDIGVFEQREKDYLAQIEALTIKAGNKMILDEEVTALSHENAFLKSQIKSLEYSLDSRHHRTPEAKTKVSDSNEKLKGFAQEKSPLLIEFEEMKKELAVFRQKEKQYDQYINEVSGRKSEKNFNESLRLQEQEDQMRLAQELNRVENSLQSLKEKELKYNKQIEVLSQEIELYTIDAEKLKIDNSMLEGKVISLNEKLSHAKKDKQHTNEMNQRLHEEINSLRGQIIELTEERDQYYHKVKLLSSQNHQNLKDDFEKLKLENQSMKIRNLVLEDKVEILEKEKVRHEDKSRRMSHDNMIGMREEIGHLNRERRDLRRENHTFKDQINTLTKPQIRISHYQDVQPKVTPTKITKESLYKESPGQRNYLESIENLKNELRHVRESREAILNSLEKERNAIKHVIEESPSTVPQYHCSNSRTPNKRSLLTVARPKLIPRSAGKYEADPKSKKEFSDLVYRPAPVTSKKITIRSLHDAKIRPRLGSKDNHELDQEKGDIHKPLEQNTFEDDQTLRDTSRFAFQILYWLTDNALITKELCSLYPINKSSEANAEIKKILQEIQIYSERAKSYYDDHSIIRSASSQKAISDFVLPLFSKCYKSHGHLQDIQNKIVSYLRGSQNQALHS